LCFSFVVITGIKHKIDAQAPHEPAAVSGACRGASTGTPEFVDDWLKLKVKKRIFFNHFQDGGHGPVSAREVNRCHQLAGFGGEVLILRLAIRGPTEAKLSQGAFNIMPTNYSNSLNFADAVTAKLQQVADGTAASAAQSVTGEGGDVEILNGCVEHLGAPILVVLGDTLRLAVLTLQQKKKAVAREEVVNRRHLADH
jgi:hypothetical protein